MIKVTYEQYYNDYIRKQNLIIHFQSLGAFKNWVESNTVGDIHSAKILWWPHRQESNCFRYNMQNGWCCFIRMIENEEGIIFTDGFYTSGKRHSSNAFYEWCQERILNQQRAQYKFVK